MHGMSLLSYHNLQFLIDLSQDARAAILAWKYWEFRDTFWRKYKS
jgi:tRNA-guanine family transglycosylase